MKLHNLYEDEGMWWLPHTLLHEREPHQNISHKVLPNFDQHVAYMRSRPHMAWYWFASNHRDTPAGAVYLSKQREIGIGVFKEHQCQGLGKAAVQEIMRLHPGKFLANVAPHNEASARLFKSLGFGLIQHTYAHD